MKKVRLKDIANRASVSQNTVSLALRDSSSVKKETKEEILQIAEEMGYISNTMDNSVKNICLLTSTQAQTDPYYFYEAKELLEARLRISGYGLLVNNILLHNLDIDYLKEFFKMNYIKGIIIMGGFPKEIINSILACEIPVIDSGFCNYNSFMDCVMEENSAGIMKMVSYLREHGYQKMGFIGNPKKSQAYLERYLGFVGALEIFDMENCNDWIIKNIDIDTDSSYEKVYKDILKALKSTASMPEVFICASDRIALGTIHALKDLNVKIPEEIGVVGFDNSKLVADSNPRLATISPNNEIQMEMIVNLLFKRIEEKNFSKIRIIVPIEIIHGETIK